MTRFFWRIFLSAWAVVMVVTALTFWAAGLLMSGESEVGGARLTAQMTTLIAQDLRRELAADPATAVDNLAANHLLDFTPMLAIYVIDPSGEDVLGRALPDSVARYVELRREQPREAIARETSNLHVRTDGLGDYLVVGYEAFFPVARTLMQPGIRWLSLTLALVMIAVASLMLTRFIVLPIRRMQLAGQRVAAGDLGVRVAHTVGSRTDEIARLARDFDIMTERVQALLQSQQRLMRDVSHELRSPLARLQALLSIARQRAGDADTPQIDRMETELERLDELIGEILSYSRLEAREHVSRHATDVVDLVQNILNDAELEAQGANKQMRLDAPDSLVLELDSGLIQRAVENVVRNALKYTGEGTAVTVRIAEENGGARITVDDQGPGVPPDALDQIFEPFYRVGDSRSTRSGTGGIGLAIAKRSISLHGGSITARNQDRGGLRIEIVLAAPHR